MRGNVRRLREAQSSPSESGGGLLRPGACLLTASVRSITGSLADAHGLVDGVVPLPARRAPDSMWIFRIRAVLPVPRRGPFGAVGAAKPRHDRIFACRSAGGGGAWRRCRGTGLGHPWLVPIVSPPSRVLRVTTMNGKFPTGPFPWSAYVPSVMVGRRDAPTRSR